MKPLTPNNLHKYNGIVYWGIDIAHIVGVTVNRISIEWEDDIHPPETYVWDGTKYVIIDSKEIRPILVWTLCIKNNKIYSIGSA